MATKTCTKCNVDKPLEMFGRDARLSSGFRADCKECRKAVSDSYYRQNKSKIVEGAREYAEANKEKIAATKRIRYERERDSILAKQKAYAKENAEKIAKAHADWHAKNPSKRKQYNRAWIDRNKTHFQSLTAKYRASKYSATPAWAEHAVIGFFYATRAYISEETGEMWHVDHVLPLQGKEVCGLHTHTNLRVVPAIVNLRKGNKLIGTRSEA